MEVVYRITFLVGVIYTLVTFLLGSLFDIVHFDGHFDANFNGHIDGHIDDMQWFTASPLKPITIVSFLTVFGGVGLMGTRGNWSQINTLIIALILGITVSYLLYRFIVVPLYKAGNTGAASIKELIGLKAVVITPILKKGFGTISYSINGNKYNAPAKHIDGEAVEQWREVVIYEIHKNVFYVK